MAEIDVEIDEPTNSVVHEPSGETFSTRIVRWHDLRPRQKSDLQGWRFDWPREAREGPGDVVGLLVKGQGRIEGMAAFETKTGFLFVNLVESAPRNVGPNKLFRGVPANLFSFLCARSFALGFDGYLAFEAKTELIEHFEVALGATRVGSSTRMILATPGARRLVEQYRKESDQWPL